MMNTYAFRRWRLALASLTIAGAAGAETLTWVASDGGDLLAAENWSPSQTPIAQDELVFDLVVGYTVTLGSDAAVDRVLVRQPGLTLDLGGTTLEVLNLDQVLGATVVGDEEDAPSSLTLASGEFVSENTRVGDAAGATGEIVVGDGARFDGVVETRIGSVAEGLLRVEAGGVAAGGLFHVGYDPGADGEVFLSGAGSMLDVGGVRVGLNGTGRLRIAPGATVAAGSLLAGFNDGSDGTVVLEGDGARIETGDGSVVIGRFGTGTLETAPGSMIEAGSLSFGGANGTGLATLESLASIAGDAVIGDSGEAEVTLLDRGVINAAQIRVGAGANGDGLAVVEQGGSLFTPGSLTIGDTTSGRGVVDLRGGSAGGDTVSVRDNGSLIGSGTVIGDLASEGLLHPEGTMLVSGDANLDAGLFGGRLRFAISNGFQTGRLTVTSGLTLGGRLQVVLDDGFEPSGSAEIELVSAASISGAFDQTTLPGEGWTLDVEPTRVVLRFQGDNPADFNGDGVVGTFDLGVLIAAWGACPACPADFNGDDVVGTFDLGFLLANWG